MTEKPNTRRSIPDRRGFQLGVIAGIPVYASTSWLIVALVLVLTYAPIVDRRIPDLAVTHTYLLAAVFVALLFGSVLAHELGHALTARKLGVPVRGMTLWMLGGFTEMRREPPSPGREFVIAAAGPVVSLVLAVVGGVGYWLAPETGIATELLWQLMASNGVLAVFNLLPGLPLDGGSLVRAVGWRFTADRHLGSIIAGWCGRIVAVLVLGLGVALAATGGSVVGLIFTAMVAIFMWFAASNAIRLGAISRRAASIGVRDLLRVAVMVDPATPLSAALAAAAQQSRAAIITVDAEGNPQGVVSPAAVDATPLQRRAWITVAELSQSVTEAMIVPLSATGAELLETLRERPAPQYVVVEAGAPVGVLITAEAIARLERK